MTMFFAPRALTLALFEPDIPQNAGTMLRMCACLGVDAAIIGPAGFATGDRHLRRAGMDYLDHVKLARHASFADFEQWRASGRGRAASCCCPPRRPPAISTPVSKAATF